MRRLFKTFAWALIMMAGLFVAGYLWLFEVLIEFALVSWTAFAIWRAPPLDTQDRASSWYSTLKEKLRFPELKDRLVKAALEGRSLQAAAAVALFGVVTGWVLVLGWLFFRDPLFVLTREVKETGVDILVFVPFVFLLADRLNVIKAAGERAAEKAESKYTGEEPADDVRDPEYHDHLLQWARAQGQVAKEWDAAFRRMLAHSFGLLTLSFLLIVFVLGPYLAGTLVSLHSPIAFLEQVAAWKI